eukprot:Skav220888  [mRNA]  locus=scaffold1977:131501:134895:+ [translate_table: standard]
MLGRRVLYTSQTTGLKSEYIVCAERIDGGCILCQSSVSFPREPLNWVAGKMLELVDPPPPPPLRNELSASNDSSSLRSKWSCNEDWSWRNDWSSWHAPCLASEDRRREVSLVWADDLERDDVRRWMTDFGPITSFWASATCKRARIQYKNHESAKAALAVKWANCVWS